MKLNERGKNSIIPCNFDRYFHRFFFFFFSSLKFDCPQFVHIDLKLIFISIINFHEILETLSNHFLFNFISFLINK